MIRRMLCVVGVAAAVAVSAGAQDMAGRVGIGGGLDGLGVRYWVNDQVGLDGTLGFAMGNDESSFKLNLLGVFVITRTERLRFAGLGGFGISNWSDKGASGTSWTTDITLGGGVGVEYSFAELPQLTFGAFATGLSLDIGTSGYTPNTGTGTSNSATTFRTSPGFWLNVRYYVN